MNFRFSFTEKYEFIYFGDESSVLPIGDLINSIVETDWEDIKNEIQNMLYGKVKNKKEIFMEAKRLIRTRIDHAAVIYLLMQTNSTEQLISKIEELNSAGNLVCCLLESLVDEVRNAYPEQIFWVMDTVDCKRFESMINAYDIARTVFTKEQPAASEADEHTTLLETNDLFSLLMFELQFICANHFHIRKCTICKKYFWTKQMNRVYCERVVATKDNIITQERFIKELKMHRPKSYALYWKRRIEIFSQTSTDNENQQYKKWLMRTEPYRDQAKKNKILLREMETVLNRIEAEIYQKIPRVHSI